MTHRVPPRGESEQSVPRHQSAVTLATAARLTTAFVVLGVALRVWNFVAVSSLWLDEILLSRNILGRGVWQLLTEPLQLDQVAPPGFLLVEKLTVLALGGHELSLFSNVTCDCWAATTFRTRPRRRPLAG